MSSTIAIHEAGHVVAALALGLEVTTVTIEQTGQSEGRTVSWVNTLEEQGIKTIAGPVAAQVCESECDHLHSCSRDDSDIESLVVVLVGLLRSVSAPASAEDIQRILRKWRLQAHGILAERRSAVYRIATALDARRTLTGEECRRLAAGE